MKLPPTLLNTLAAAVASIGFAGCGPVETTPTTNEPTNSPGVSGPKPSGGPQENTPNPLPVNKPNKNRLPDDCPGCGMG
jgi:hypothetical protein